MIQMFGNTYKLIDNNKEGWDSETFESKYCEILDKYDYIVGDWGYNQLRLFGLYKNNHQCATEDTKIKALEDYIIEYCNFGCAYFVLEKVNNT